MDDGRSARALFRALRPILPLVSVPHACPNLRMAKFEQFVLDALRDVVSDKSNALAREVNVRVARPSLTIAKVLDGVGRASCGMPLSRPLGAGTRSLSLRFDFVWWDAKHACVRIVEADGMQHIRSGGLFYKTGRGAFEHRVRRDALKDWIVRSAFPSVCMMRVSYLLVRHRWGDRELRAALRKWITQPPDGPIVHAGPYARRCEATNLFEDPRTRALLRSGFAEWNRVRRHTLRCLDDGIRPFLGRERRLRRQRFWDTYAESGC